MELVRLCITRIYAHWSTDEIHLQNFMNEIVANHILPPSSIISSTNLHDLKQIQHNQQQVRLILSPINSTELLPLVFDELCGRADMIGFIRFISDGVGSIGKSLLQNGTSEISNICLHVIEPICQRFDFVSSSGKIPVALRCILIAIFNQSRGDERIQNSLLLLFIDSFLPRVTRWLLNSNSTFHSLGDDVISIGEQTQLMETIQDLLKICFTRGTGASSTSIYSSTGGVGGGVYPSSSLSLSPSMNNNHNHNVIGIGIGSNESNYTIKSKSHISNYSLQTHATLSRSKWLISRYL